MLTFLLAEFHVLFTMLIYTGKKIRYVAGLMLRSSAAIGSRATQHQTSNIL